MIITIKEKIPDPRPNERTLIIKLIDSNANPENFPIFEFAVIHF